MGLVTLNPDLRVLLLTDAKISKRRMRFTSAGRLTVTLAAPLASPRSIGGQAYAHLLSLANTLNLADGLDATP